MYRASTGHKFILIVTDEVTNYFVIIPLYRGTSNEVGTVLINHVFCKHASPYLIFDEDQPFLPCVMQYIYKRLGIKIKTIIPYNHFSLKPERHIRTISEIIAKKFTGTGVMWTHYLSTFTHAYNNFCKPSIKWIKSISTNLW